MAYLCIVPMEGTLSRLYLELVTLEQLLKLIMTDWLKPSLICIERVFYDNFSTRIGQTGYIEVLETFLTMYICT